MEETELRTSFIVGGNRIEVNFIDGGNIIEDKFYWWLGSTFVVGLRGLLHHQPMDGGRKQNRGQVLLMEET